MGFKHKVITKMNKNRYKNAIFQIYVPVIFAALLILGIAVFFSLPNSKSILPTRIWADISFILLSIPMLFFGLLLFALFIVLIILFSKLNNFTNYNFRSVSHIIVQYLNKFSAIVTEIVGRVIAIISWTKIFNPKNNHSKE